MTYLILDASMALEWFVPGSGSDAALAKRSLLDDHLAVVTPIWPWEIINFWAWRIRKRIVTTDEAVVRLHDMLALPFAVADPGPPAACLALCARLGLTAYDAGYLQLAVAINAPLATLDKALIGAAEAVGVEIA
ncbi:MAG: type II toxin-antitoxin system VapC family toxin [Actinomycetota bacterium]|nr:type II toxin-antitoxin system VapC family toxin [Actinomycetota bacterium]